MSYINKPAMGDLLDFARSRGLVPSEEIECFNKATNSQEVLRINGIIDNLSKNWRPTGYYRPAEVRQLLDTFATEAEAAGAAVAAAPTMMSDEVARGLKAQAFEDMLRKYKDQSRSYEAAILQAKSAGINAINAPGLKDWVLRSLQSISDAYVTAAVLACSAGILGRAVQVISKLGDVIIRIGGVLLDAGEAAIDAVEKGGELLAFLIKYAPYAAAGIGAYMVFNLLKRN